MRGAKKQPFCRKGHVLSNDNLTIVKNGRRCRICQNARSKKWHRARRLELAKQGIKIYKNTSLKRR